MPRLLEWIDGGGTNGGMRRWSSEPSVDTRALPRHAPPFSGEPSVGRRYSEADSRAGRV